MKIVNLILINIALVLLFNACGESEQEKGDNKKEDTVENHVENVYLYSDLSEIVVWQKRSDGMNSTLYRATTEKDMEPFKNIISNKELSPVKCGFNGGVTFIKKDSSIIMSEFNVSESCSYISYFDKAGELKFFELTKEGKELILKKFEKR